MNLARYLFTSLICFQFLFIRVNGQFNPDSLIDLYNSTRNDTIKLQYLIDLNRYYINRDFEKAIEYGFEGIEIASRQNHLPSLAILHNNIGIIFRSMGFYEMAIEHYFSSLRIKEQLGDKQSVARTFTNIGNIYGQMGLFEDARNYYNKSLGIHEEMDNSEGIAAVSTNIGANYYEIGEYDEAFRLYEKTLDIFIELRDTSNLISALINIGETKQAQGFLDSAKYYFTRAEKLSKIINEKIKIVRSNLYLGKLYYILEDYQRAKNTTLEAYNLADEINSIQSQFEAAELLNKVYKDIGNYQEALRYSEIHDDLSDSLNLNQTTKRITELELGYQFEKERAIQEQIIRRNKIVRNLLIMISVIGVLLTFYIYRSYRIKQKANQLLAEIDELKSRMFSNISHEFRTPLTLILGPLEEMIEADASGRPSGKNLKMMQRNARRLLDLVNQMLDLSKMDAGKLKLELVHGDLIQVLRTMILSFTSMAEQKNITFKYEIPDQSYITCYDPDKLEKIINNLLSNAFKFTPQNGTVSVDVNISSESRTTIRPPFTSENPVLEMSVRDSGKGIPEDQLTGVFERFRQVEGSSEVDQIGTGIGLALTKELLELMHGRITVESTVGKGTQFNIYLPLGREHLKENEYSLIEEKEIPGGKEKAAGGEFVPETVEERIAYTEGDGDLPLILVVDDHPDIRSHVREHLTDFRVYEASDGVEGLEISTEHIPDLVVTDLMMPSMDGVELCKNLKTDERTSHIPVIMLTAKATVENRIEGLETGADDYITKPFNMKELLTRINNLIDQRRKLRERFSREVTLQPKEIAITSADERFLNRTIEIIENRMGEEDFDVAALQKDIGLSHMQMFRKLKALTDQAPRDFIRTIRLKRSANLLEQKFGNVAEVAYEVGFNNLSYFAKCFKEMFGQAPSEYLKDKS